MTFFTGLFALNAVQTESSRGGGKTLADSMSGLFPGKSGFGKDDIVRLLHHMFAFHCVMI